MNEEDTSEHTADHIPEKLSALLEKEDKLLKSRITPKSLREILNKKLAHVKMSDGDIFACVALWPTKDAEWFELGTLWVHPDWRHKGISTELFTMFDTSHSDKHKFLITRSLKVVHLAETHGWQEEKGNWTKNTFWKNLCEPWDHTPEHGTRVLPKEGRLFFKKAL